jgi:hypothetical protein
VESGWGYLSETERKVAGSFIKELREKLGYEMPSVWMTQVYFLRVC